VIGRLLGGLLGAGPTLLGPGEHAPVTEVVVFADADRRVVLRPAARQLLDDEEEAILALMAAELL
jgi:hypothetical protein